MGYYQTKYYKQIVSKGQTWRLEIQQDVEELLTPVEIGPVLQGLRVIVQGDQADIDTPIVKTSLEMLFVDAPDLEDERKCGFWEEFYTSSATGFRVVLFRITTSDVFPIAEWTGYITPDSFSEDLQYRGSVSIIARDNLGTLQDYEYNAEVLENGMISLQDLIDKALSVISFPMSYRFAYLFFEEYRHFPKTADNNPIGINKVLFNQKAFVGKTWLQVLEAALSSVGCVMRYTGEGLFIVSSLRDIPLYDKDYWWNVPVLDVSFCTYGHRQLSPAAKAIIGTTQFEIEENIADVEMPADVYGEEVEYTFTDKHVDTSNFDPIVYQMPVCMASGGSWRTESIETAMFLNPFKYKLKEGHTSKTLGDLRSENVVYLASNTEENTKKATYSESVGAGKHKVSFGFGNIVSLYDDNTKIGFTDHYYYIMWYSYSLTFISYDGSVVRSYDHYKGWQNNSEIITKVYVDTSTVGLPPFKVEIPALETDVAGTFTLTFYWFDVYTVSPPSLSSRGAYIPITDLVIKDENLENTLLPSSQKTTTNYNKNNNVLIQLDSPFGFGYGDVSSPKIIKNGMFVHKDLWYSDAENWVFSASDDPNPLPVLIHQQILAYNAKPNNFLTGELAVEKPTFNSLYRWKDKLHIITSGMFNVLSGRMENVSLREFDRYDYMWETWLEKDSIEVDYASKIVKVKARTNKALASLEMIYPDWVLIAVTQPAPNEYTFEFHFTENNSGQVREDIIKIDSFFLRVRQLASGDYGIDYGKDYS